MLVLLLFAFLSGLLTIAAPCIWPLLPIILSSSSTGGKTKPLGITLGIITSFAFFTLTLSYLVRIIPFDPNILRLFAVLVIGFFGLSLLVPALNNLVEGFLIRLTAKISPVRNSADHGLLSGFVTGFSLGLVWSPCAGPILATIAALAATRAVNTGLVLVTLVYVIGVGIPLFLFAAMGNRLFSKVRLLSKYTGRLQQFFGFIMLLTALSIFTNFDKTLQTRLLDLIPSYSVFLTRLESNPQVTQALNSLKGSPAANLADFTPAADFTGITHWLNTDKPLSLADLKGRVVLVDFWTYTCINCLRTLPHVIGWYDKYKAAGFVVIGVHTPEFEFEKTTSNVQSAVARLGIHYPVAQDNNYATWNAYSNQYWPAEYLIDSQGRLRRSHFGEGDYASTEILIRSLLAEAGQNPGGDLISVPDQTPAAAISPETYFGSARMQYYYPGGSLSNGTRSFTLAAQPNRNNFSFGGTWSITDESAAAGAAASLNYSFTATKVFVILRPGSASTNLVKVYLDNQPITSAQAGSDVHDGLVSVDSDRLYNVVALPGPAENHLLKLEFLTPEIQIFTFTFG